MATQQPDVSIIVLVKNGGRDCQEMLRAVLQQELDGACEIILIDSGSSDGTPEAAERICADRRENPRAIPLLLRRIPPHEFGHGRTRNLAASLAAGGILLYLVADARPVGRRWLATLLAPLVRPEVAGAFGRQVARPDASPLERYFLLQAYPDLPEQRLITSRAAFGVGKILFSNVSSTMRRKVWADHPFHDDLVMSEDQEWAVRVLQAGHSLVYEPRAVVEHSHHYGLRTVFRRNFDSGVSLRGMGLDHSAARPADGLRYLIGEACYLLTTGQSAHLPYMAIYEAARIGGFTCGRYHTLIPNRIKPHLGYYRSYWQHRAP